MSSNTRPLSLHTKFMLLTGVTSLLIAALAGWSLPRIQTGLEQSQRAISTSEQGVTHIRQVLGQVQAEQRRLAAEGPSGTTLLTGTTALLTALIPVLADDEHAVIQRARQGVHRYLASLAPAKDASDAKPGDAWATTPPSREAELHDLATDLQALRDAAEWRQRSAQVSAETARDGQRLALSAAALSVAGLALILGTSGVGAWRRYRRRQQWAAPLFQSEFAG